MKTYYSLFCLVDGFEGNVFYFDNLEEAKDFQREFKGSKITVYNCKNKKLIKYAEENVRMSREDIKVIRNYWS